MLIFFYFFAFLLVISSIMVITSHTPVYAVLWLILAFCNTAGIMVIMGAEFLAMMIVIIYVGAVAVLFLFVVMMLDSTPYKQKMKALTIKQIRNTTIIVFFLFSNLILLVLTAKKNNLVVNSSKPIMVNCINDTYKIGKVLYTDFILPFQTTGIVLFTAMIASISLTLRVRQEVKKQKSSNQVKRTKENSISFAKNTGEFGLKNLNYDD